MRKWLPWIIAGVFTAWIIGGLRPEKEDSQFNVNAFAKLPVVLNGRIQPFDSVGINSLLSMRGKRTVGTEERKWYEFSKKSNKISAREWLLLVMTRPDEADKYKTFRIQHPDLQGLLGQPEGGLEYYTYAQLDPHIDKIQAQAAPIREALAKRTRDSKELNPYERDLMHLYDSMVLYRRLKNSLRPEMDFPRPSMLEGKEAGDFVAELELYRKAVKTGLEAFRKYQAGEDFDAEDLQLMVEFHKRYSIVETFAYPLAVPPLHPDNARERWSNVGTNLMEALHTGDIHPAVMSYAKIATAYRYNRPAEFNSAVSEYRQWMASKGLTKELKKGEREFFFNQFEPFYKSTVLYVMALLIGCAFWLNWSEWVRKSAFLLLTIALIVHTAGLIFRMYLEGRPPVTNLYSSAIFIGWGAVVLGVILERIYREGIGIVVAAAIGFTTQIIAHHLSLSGDTMQMLQAVLDTNFWLATHVVVITAGYSAMFIAGVLAIVYVLRGMFTKTLKASTAKALSRMVYGVICFATLFSFVGTILGGIWADQSWGRFWGWDPKENGALLIVIWCAIILHARWGGLIKERGLMAMAIFGNVVTSFSWFGVNMLGVGLHSYGFMDKAFKWLLLFVVTQMILIGMAMLPPRFWLSFRGARQSPDGDSTGSGLGGERPASVGA